jgi:hypothetical protein
MRVRDAVWTICATLLLASAVSAQEKVKLEYKLKPGTELLYKISGAVSMTASSEGHAHPLLLRLSGWLRIIVADVDDTGAILIGCRMDRKIAAKKTGVLMSEEAHTTDSEFSICRMNRAGSPILLMPSDSNLSPSAQLGKSALFDFYRREPYPITLPSGEVLNGETWSSQIDNAVLMGMGTDSLPMRISSTLTEVKVVDGRKCALIESRYSSLLAGFDVSGGVKTFFDIEGGFARNVVARLSVTNSIAREGGKKEELTDAADVTLSLESAKPLPEEQAAALRQALKVVEEMVLTLGAGNPAKAQAAAGRLKVEGVPQVWLAGISAASAKLKELAAGVRVLHMAGHPQ